jgi:hypothetical protein
VVVIIVELPLIYKKAEITEFCSMAYFNYFGVRMAKTFLKKICCGSRVDV